MVTSTRALKISISKENSLIYVLIRELFAGRIGGKEGEQYENSVCGASTMYQLLYIYSIVQS